VSDEGQLAVVSARLGSLIDDVTEIKRSMREMALAMTRLAVFEERQVTDREGLGRAFDAIGQIDGRVKSLEQAQPIQKQTSDWVHKILGQVVSLVVGAVIALVVVDKVVVDQRKPAIERRLPVPEGTK
jgi:tetrahydromethanopterin S-methyltransferase subunit C